MTPALHLLQSLKTPQSSSTPRTPPQNCFTFLCHLQPSADILSHCKLPHVSPRPPGNAPCPPRLPQHPFLPPAPQLLHPPCPILTQQGLSSDRVSYLYQGFAPSTAHLFPYHQTRTKSPLTETYVCTSITPYLTETIFSLNKVHMAQPLTVKALQHHYLFSE